MQSPKRVSLLLAVTLFISVMVLLVATLNIGEASVPVQTLRSKVLRRHDRTKSKPDAREIEYLRKHAQEEKREERVFDDQIPKHLPIKVKIRAEKEKAAKDLGNERWHRDLEIEVKNTGDRPIYHLVLILELPETKVGGHEVIFDLRYGQHSLFDSSKGKAKPGDIALKPGETYVFRLLDNEATAWEGFKRRENWPQPKKVLLRFEQLNFGDGTGFWGSSGDPWPLSPSQKQGFGAHMRSSNKSPIRAHHVQVVWRQTDYSLNLGSGGEPAHSLPASFRSLRWLDFRSLSPEPEETAPQPDECCPGSCQYLNVYDDELPDKVAMHVRRCTMPILLIALNWGFARLLI